MENDSLKYAESRLAASCVLKIAQKNPTCLVLHCATALTSAWYCGPGMTGATLCCRVHAQTLLVLDDEDFHERQDMLSLGQHRAIATALNSMVFHTHCPAAQPAQSGGKTPTQGHLPAMRGMQALEAGLLRTHLVKTKEEPLYLHAAAPMARLQGRL